MTFAFRTYLSVIAALFLSLQGAFAQEDLNDTQLRLNPEIGSDNTLANVKVRHYPFINYNANKIDLNGDDWSELRSKLKQCKENGNFTVVHIGDSHIQPDGNTGRVRELFQQKYGDAGRGIIIPFRMAGTNEPRDYVIKSDDPFIRARLLSMPWPTQMGFTGVSLEPESYIFSISLSVKSPCGFFTILSSGDLNLKKVESNGENIKFTSEKVVDGVDVSLDSDCTEMTLTMEGRNVNIFGFNLQNDNNGVVYHSIGNNGAAYSSYNSLPKFGESIADLCPDLVVLALGTNEAFGTVNEAAFEAQIEMMIKSIRSGSPDVKFLLVTPSECQKSVYSTTYSGKGRRRRARRVKSYQVNQKVKTVRDIIVRYGKKHNIPVYDFYEIAGGAGASSKWLEENLLNTDRIHRTWEGYKVEGELIYQALSDALEKHRSQRR
ncbi:MAG: hypothetical protein K2K84_01940 [Muribaculaceae bacterium]|nr:hypothetical protein [Muribaculaceae bacterium]